HSARGPPRRRGRGGRRPRLLVSCRSGGATRRSCDDSGRVLARTPVAANGPTPIMTTRKPPSDSLLTRNRRATFEFSILEKIEAGVELTGAEVKSLRSGRAQLRDGYVRIENGEAWLLQVNITPYEQGNRNNAEADRRRKLLLHKREIEYLDAKVRTQGLTIVPVRMYLVRNHGKVEIGLARGKKLWDKRQDVARRDAQRDMERVAARTRLGS